MSYRRKMKRFFKPLEKQKEKDGPDQKKPALSSPPPQPHHHQADRPCDTNEKEPLKLVTWKANILLLCVKNNWPQFSNFVSDLDPDDIAIQDVRMPAAGAKGVPKNPGELKDDTSSFIRMMLLRALATPTFGEYRVWWSLGDSKYAGTPLLLKKCFPPKVFFSLDRKEFDTCHVLNTYSSNNGCKDEENAFQRRRKWDKRLVDFVLQSSDKPLNWCGDLNVSYAKLNGYVPTNMEDCGQPGFTLVERKLFGTILKDYRGKRTRIDYFLVSEKLKDQILKCTMHGRGIEPEGFYGSDHCPVSLELSESRLDSVASDAV